MSRTPVNLLGSSLRDLIGGRWAVSLVLFCVYVPLGIFATIGNLSTTVQGTTLGQLLVASTISLVPVGLILWASHLTWLRHRRVRPVPVVTIVLLGGVIGIVRSASMYAASVWLGLQEPDTALAWTRTLSGGVQGATLYPLGVLAIALIATYREQRRQLIAAQVGWESRRLNDAREWAHLRDEVVAPIADELSSLSEGLDSHVITVDAAASAVRRRAHTLWGDAEPTPLMPRVSLMATIVASLRVRPFATWLILLLWLPTVMGTALAVGEIPRAPLGAIAAGAVLVITFEVANAIAARWPRTWWVVLPIGLMIAIIATSPSVGIFGAPESLGNREYTIVNAVWITLLVVITSIVVGALRRGQGILAELHASVDAASIATLAQEGERRRVVHEVAATLHGTLQGRLASVGDQDSASDAVRETLARLRSGGVMTESALLDQTADAALRPWMSLVDVRIECPSGPISSSTAQAVSDALEECAANAFRHGHATRLDCRIERSERHVHLTVRDDGHGSSPATSTPGLGSRILDRCGTWTRTHDAGGTTVTISIPI